MSQIPKSGSNRTIWVSLHILLADVHFELLNEGDVSMSIARDSFANVGSGGHAARHILLVDRGTSARRLSNEMRVREAISAVLVSTPGLDASIRQLPIISWKPQKNVSLDVAAFRAAALIVAPHGAGLSNILFAKEGTPVIEICYDSNGGRLKEMLCPAMYAAMAVNLNLPYWVVTGHGSYTSAIRCDLAQLSAALQQAVAIIARGPQVPRRCGSRAADSRDEPEGVPDQAG